MPEIDYYVGLARTAPLGAVARALVRRAARRLRPRPRARALADRERLSASEALLAAPRLFAPAQPAELAARVPDAPARLTARARRILDGEAELFGRWRTLAEARRESDPKWVWELSRGGHLVELGAAAWAVPPLAVAARAEIARQIDAFLDEHQTGVGEAYAWPIEVALRGIHWLAALELAGGARAFLPAFIERLAPALLADARFLAANLEDEGAVPANHLLADQVGILVLAGAVGERRLARGARRAIAKEARRQVGKDGAHFEASTAYQRFALELFLVAELASRAAGAKPLVPQTLARMFRFVRGTAMPGGIDPGFGDGDDARLLPIVPRAPRDHGYLLGLGLALTGDPDLRAPDVAAAEEALWWLGAAAYDAWARTPPTPPAPATSFPTGGIHVLRSPRLTVAMRAGSTGQAGVGGHGHNDALSIVAFADGEPLIVDPGTASYADPVVRNRFRGTAAHATVVIDGQEQSPLIDGRPFALLDRARARLVEIEDSDHWARLVAEHVGYRRLKARVRHQRRLVLVRDPPRLVIEDHLSGRGAGTVEVRFPVAGEARALTPLVRLRAEREGAHDLDFANAVELADGRAVLAPVKTGVALERVLGTGWVSTRYGGYATGGLVSFRAALTFPSAIVIALLLLGTTHE